MLSIRRVSGMLVAAIVAAGACAASAADLVAEVIRLRYRSAEQVLPLVQPLVPRPGAVSGSGSDLVLRTTRTNLAEVKRVIESIDRAPRRLLVTVRQDAASEGPIDPSASHAQARTYGTRAVDGDRAVQRIQVGDGGEALVHVGQAVPVVLRSAGPHGGRGRGADDRGDVVAFRDLASGFVVRPRVDGETVSLDIETRHDVPGTHGRGSAEFQRTSTTISGRIGQWIEVGAILAGDPSPSAGSTYSTRSADGRTRRILVKVDAID